MRTITLRGASLYLHHHVLPPYMRKISFQIVKLFTRQGYRRNTDTFSFILTYSKRFYNFSRCLVLAFLKHTCSGEFWSTTTPAAMVRQMSPRCLRINCRTVLSQSVIKTAPGLSYVASATSKGYLVHDTHLARYERCRVLFGARTFFFATIHHRAHTGQLLWSRENHRHTAFCCHLL